MTARVYHIPSRDEMPLLGGRQRGSQLPAAAAIIPLRRGFLTPEEQRWHQQPLDERDRLAREQRKARNIASTIAATEAAQRIDLYASLNHDTALVRWGRRWSARIGIGLYVLGVVVACYFAFQMGRGL